VSVIGINAVGHLALSGRRLLDLPAVDSVAWFGKYDCIYNSLREISINKELKKYENQKQMG
jgi:hypothetical protein